MNKVSYGLLAAQFVALIYGLLSEIGYPDALTRLPDGMGLSLAIISSTMAVVLMHIEIESRERERNKERDTVLGKH